MKYFQFSLKLPNIDPFYRKQTRSLNALYNSAIGLSTTLFKTRNPQEAYDPDEGGKYIRSFVASVKAMDKLLGDPAISRILRRRSRGTFVSKAELDRDIARSEVFQENIEYELHLLHRRKVLCLAISHLTIALIAYSFLCWTVIKAFLWRGIF